MMSFGIPIAACLMAIRSLLPLCNFKPQRWAHGSSAIFPGLFGQELWSLVLLWSLVDSVCMDDCLWYMQFLVFSHQLPTQVTFMVIEQSWRVQLQIFYSVWYPSMQGSKTLCLHCEVSFWRLAWTLFSLFKFSYIRGLDSFVQGHDKNYFSLVWSLSVTQSPFGPLLLLWNGRETYVWEEAAVSCRRAGWVWEITGWSSRLQEIYRSF